MTRYHTFMAGQSRASRVAYWVARAAVVTFCRVWTRLTIEGKEHVPPTGPYILAPVHRSNLDTPITSGVTPRRVRFMGKDSLWKKRFPAWALSTLGGFPVSRGTYDFEAMKRCLEVLDAGEPLVLFPEGERKSGPDVQPLFDGAAYLALKANVPIVPVGIGRFRAGDAKGVEDDPPPQGARDRGAAARARHAGQRSGAPRSASVS